jgi:hypothetical protein
VGEFARTHDVNASDFGWANLERSCYGTDRQFPANGFPVR